MVTKRRIFRVVDGKKGCTACGEIKPIADYHRKYKDKTFPIEGKCIVCRRAARRGVPDPRKRIRKSSPKCPIKRRAQGRVRDAVRYGKIVKPDYCEKCNSITDNKNLHGHHHKGYENALDVEWLCRGCHAREHWK